MRIKVLLTSSGGVLGPEFLRLLKTIKKYEVISFAVDSNKDAMSKNFSDFFHTVSKGRTKKFISQIKNLTKKYNINLVLPGSDEDALNLSKNRKIIENDITKIACVNYSTLKILSNKQKTYDYLKKQNFDTPEYFTVKTKSNLLKCINYFINKNGAAVIKPSISRGGRNVFVIKKNLKKIIKRNDGREIELGIKNFLKNFKKYKINFYPIVVMEKLKSPTFDFDMLCLKGKMVTGITRKRINPSVPNDGHLIYNDNRLKNLGKKIAKIFNLHWLYDCDFMYDKFSKPKIIEINPRMSGSVSVSISAGIPLIENLINIYLNKGVKQFKLSRKTEIIPSVSLFKK